MSSPGHYIRGRNTLLPTILWLTYQSFMREDGLHWRKALHQRDWVRNSCLWAAHRPFSRPLFQKAHKSPGAAFSFVWTARLWPLPLPAMPWVMERKTENYWQPRTAACSAGCAFQDSGFWWTGAVKGLLSSVNTSEIPAGSSRVLMFYKEREVRACQSPFNEPGV